MLCFEGIAQALAIFQGKMKIPQYKLSQPTQLEVLTIKPEVNQFLGEVNVDGADSTLCSRCDS